MKFGSKLPIQGPNKQGTVGTAKPMTPGTQKIETPAKIGGVSAIKSITPGSQKIDTPVNK